MKKIITISTAFALSIGLGASFLADGLTDTVKAEEQFKVSGVSFNSKSIQKGSTGTVTVSYLNVRSGAGKNYKVVSSLKKGMKVTFNEISGEWGKVSYGKGTGYVHLSYISENKPSTSVSGNYISATGTAQIKASVLNIRSGPGTNFAKKGTIVKNQEAAIKGISGEWVLISFNNLEGYVKASYTTLKGTEGGIFYANTKVNASALNLRKGPSTSYKSIGVVKKGETVKVLSVSGKWAKVAVGTAEAYVNYQYLSPVN